MATKNRTRFIERSLADTRKDAELLAPSWTTVIMCVLGGWMCYEAAPPKDMPKDVWCGGYDR